MKHECAQTEHEYVLGVTYNINGSFNFCPNDFVDPRHMSKHSFCLVINKKTLH